MSSPWFLLSARTAGDKTPRKRSCTNGNVNIFYGTWELFKVVKVFRCFQLLESGQIGFPVGKICSKLLKRTQKSNISSSWVLATAMVAMASNAISIWSTFGGFPLLPQQQVSGIMFGLIRLRRITPRQPFPSPKNGDFIKLLLVTQYTVTHTGANLQISRGIGSNLFGKKKKKRPIGDNRVPRRRQERGPGGGGVGGGATV